MRVRTEAGRTLRAPERARAGLMPRKISRREVLKTALASPIVLATAAAVRGQSPNFARLRGSVVAADGTTPKHVQLVRRWRGPLCTSHLVNRGKQSVQIKEVVLLDIPLTASRETRLYGEGFQ